MFIYYNSVKFHEISADSSFTNASWKLYGISISLLNPLKTRLHWENTSCLTYSWQLLPPLQAIYHYIPKNTLLQQAKNSSENFAPLMCWLNSVQELFEIEAWLLPTFFICLHNQLISIHSIVTYYMTRMFEKCDSLNRQKWVVASFNISASFTAKFNLIFVLTQENAFS